MRACVHDYYSIPRALLSIIRVAGDGRTKLTVHTRHGRGLRAYTLGTGSTRTTLDGKINSSLLLNFFLLLLLLLRNARCAEESGVSFPLDERAR